MSCFLNGFVDEITKVGMLGMAPRSHTAGMMGRIPGASGVASGTPGVMGRGAGLQNFGGKQRKAYTDRKNPTDMPGYQPPKAKPNS